MNRSRDWVLTFNNYSEKDYGILINSLDSTYFVLGREVGVKGTQHIQGYCHFKRALSLDDLKGDYDNRIHWEIMKGSPSEASTYCKKEGQFDEYGVIPSQGKRNDIKRVKELINEGKGMVEICEEVNSYQAMKCGELILKYQKKKPIVKNVIWICGPSGTGKSEMAWNMLPNAYCFGETGDFWDGYDGEPDVIIDDYRMGTISFRLLLRILDPYPCRVPTKGGSRQLAAQNIIITAPNPPEYYIPFGEEALQLLRRIKKIIKKNLKPEVGGNTSPDTEPEEQEDYDEEGYLVL